ncbi:hypothetical protein GF389_02805 [Candidatus Dojkabacteria bacterium]|nr:hypothetical protein [Candidatus Dojkabacteria bacterium]
MSEKDSQEHKKEDAVHKPLPSHEKNNHSTTPTESRKADDNTDELSIDFRGAWTFVKKHSTLFILLAVLLLQFVPNFGLFPWGGIWMRMQTEDLPITDQWAQNTFENSLKAQMLDAINQQYPHLPEDQKNALASQEYQKQYEANKEAFDAQIAQLSQQFKSFYRYEVNGKEYTYMPDIDPYYYLRQARNIIIQGTFEDEMRDEEPWDTHVYAPLGIRTGKNLHAYTLAYLHKFLGIVTGFSLMQSSTYFSVLFIFLSLIPAFFIGRRLSGNIGGFFTATLVAISSAIMGRTPWGHADTDAYNVFFPLLIVWLLMESFSEKNTLRRVLFAGLSGISIGIFSFGWSGWWFLFDFIIATFAVSILYQLAVTCVDRRKLYIPHSLRQLLLSMGSFIFFSAISVSTFLRFSTFIKAPLEPLGFTTIKNAAHANLWPNVYTTVAELNPGNLTTIINSVGGQFLFVLALIGVVLMVYTVRDEQGRFDVKYSALLAIWFIGTIYASLKGIRFTLLLAPAFAIALGAFFGITYSYLSKWLSKELKISKKITSPLLIIAFAAILIGAQMPQQSYAQATHDIPIMNDAWWATLTKIRDTSEPDAIINSWWDFGHHFKYVANRAVTFDGASQNTPMAHWIGKALLTDDEKEAMAILRMLDCGSNTAYDELLKQLEDPLRTIKTLKELIMLDKDEAQSFLEEEGLDPSPILPLTHCEPPENYFITSDDMVGKAGVWGHFGSWNFERAYIWLELKDKPRQEALEEMMTRFNYTEEQASDLLFEAQTLPSEEAANQWIAPWPGYLSGPSGCTTAEGNLVCSNGVRIINGTGYITTQQGTGKLNSYSYIDENGTFIVKKQENGTSGVSTILKPSDTTVQSILCAPELAGSMFTRLFYLQGHGLQYFDLFSEERQLTGQPLYTWKVDWQGTDENDIYGPKEFVSAGDSVSVNYIGWLDNGTIFDSSILGWFEQNITTESDFEEYQTNPLTFTAGAGNVIKGFDDAVIGMKPGEEKIITIAPENAYGTDPEAHELGNESLSFRILIEKIQ